ncbi:CCNB3 protein, partial [Polyodon spathula]|nr:CCNB3 protein [Polyodon spathula]
MADIKAPVILLERRRQCHQRQRTTPCTFRPHQDRTQLPDHLLVDRFRFDRNTIEYVCDVLQPHLISRYARNAILNILTKRKAEDQPETLNKKDKRIKCAKDQTNEKCLKQNVLKKLTTEKNKDAAQHVVHKPNKSLAIFPLADYMDKQLDLSKRKRAIVVDWMIEVQEHFELSHETLYLAVKLMDHYLTKCQCKTENLQLVAATAFLIAAKEMFQERCTPLVEEFLFVCSGTYSRKHILVMERRILTVLGFDINIPEPYSFIRRYAKCARSNLLTLTLARYICEMTLQEYEFLQERSSKLAAACLFLAMKMASSGDWTQTLVHHTGYEEEDLVPIMEKLSSIISTQNGKLKAVYTKYSHRQV